MSQIMQDFTGHHKVGMDVIQGVNREPLSDSGSYSLSRTEGEVITVSDEGEKR